MSMSARASPIGFGPSYRAFSAITCRDRPCEGYARLDSFVVQGDAPYAERSVTYG